jgi:hypothetical protein
MDYTKLLLASYLSRISLNNVLRDTSMTHWRQSPNAYLDDYDKRRLEEGWVDRRIQDRHAGLE